MPEEVIVNGRTHEYHAEAKALHGELKRPFLQVIPPQALAQLHPLGGYLDQYGESFGAERVISYGAAYTHVSGSLETKDGAGWCTLTTCAVTDLNILDVVTADRIVAQIYTDHPLEGHVPRISFLASRFENLCIAGHKVNIGIDRDILGPKPDGDAGYSRDPKLLAKLRGRSSRILGFAGVPSHARDPYNQIPKKVLLKDAEGNPKETEILECSLVTSSASDYPADFFGHAIHIPDFGEIYLATVKVISEDFIEPDTPRKTTVELKMIEARLGCAATGTVSGGVAITNGATKP
jgi:hypothetical protein